MSDNDAHFEDGRPVPIAPTPEETLEDVLMKRGVQTDDLGEIIELCRQRGRAEAVALLAEIFSRLDGTAAGVALRIAIYGPGNTSLRELAEPLGISHVALWKQAERIRKRLGGLTAAP